MKRKILISISIIFVALCGTILYFRKSPIQGVITTPSSTDIQKIGEAIKKVESEQPPRIGKSPTETEINNSPYIKHIRIALNGFLDGTNTGVEADALDNTGGSDCGLNNFDKTYYQSKFIILDASDDDYGGVQSDIVFINKPDTLFWTWVYRLGGNGEYVLRGFCANGPSEEKRVEFNSYVSELIKNAKYLY